VRLHSNFHRQASATCLMWYMWFMVKAKEPAQRSLPWHTASSMLCTCVTCIPLRNNLHQRNKPIGPCKEHLPLPSVAAGARGPGHSGHHSWVTAGHVHASIWPRAVHPREGLHSAPARCCRTPVQLGTRHATETNMDRRSVHQPPTYHAWLCAADSHPHLHKMRVGRPEERLPCGSTTAAPSGNGPMSRPTQRATGTRARVQTTAGGCPAARSASHRASCQPALAPRACPHYKPMGGCACAYHSAAGCHQPLCKSHSTKHTLNTTAKLPANTPGSSSCGNTSSTPATAVKAGTRARKGRHLHLGPGHMKSAAQTTSTAPFWWQRLSLNTHTRGQPPAGNPSYSATQACTVT
jgi:hypothetical protein